MRWFRRRGPLPADRRPALAPEERVLAWASVAGDAVVVATNLGLFRPGHDERLGWHEVHKVTWSGRALTIVPATVVTGHPGYTEMADGPAESYLLLDPDDLPDQVRSRVTKSVAFSTHHDLPGGGVRVVARRVPGVDGLAWAARYDPGTPPADEAVTALVAAARSGAYD